jgi:hypothetical protein
MHRYSFPISIIDNLKSAKWTWLYRIVSIKKIQVKKLDGLGGETIIPVLTIAPIILFTSVTGCIPYYPDTLVTEKPEIPT